LANAKQDWRDAIDDVDWRATAGELSPAGGRHANDRQVCRADTGSITGADNDYFPRGHNEKHRPKPRRTHRRTCLRVYAAIVFSSVDIAESGPRPIKLIVVPLIGGAFAGNFLWRLVFKKPK
jgi:hypothetical protein